MSCSCNSCCENQTYQDAYDDGYEAGRFEASEQIRNHTPTATPGTGEYKQVISTLETAHLLALGYDINEVIA